MNNRTTINICAAALIGLAATPCLGGVPSESDQQPSAISSATEAPSDPGISAQSAVNRQAEYIHIVQDTIKEGAFDAYEGLQIARAKLLAAAKWPRVSIGLRPMTGPSLEVLHIGFFNSFEELGASAKALEDNPVLRARLKEIDRKEMLLLKGRVEVDARYRPAISYHGDFNWADMRFLSLIKIHLIPGHGAEYTQNRDIVIKAHIDSALPENLAIYTVNSGTLSSSYRIIRPVTSLKGFDEMDKMHGERYEGILGKENQRKLVSLFGQSVQTEEEEYYVLDNNLSYTTKEFAGSNASYWNKVGSK